MRVYFYLHTGNSTDGVFCSTVNSHRWGARVVLHWKDGSVMQLHYYISAVVSASLLESFLWYIDYEYFNDTGTRPYTLTLLAVVVGAARESVSRTLVLVVSLFLFPYLYFRTTGQFV